jgi:hypothetical protein
MTIKKAVEYKDDIIAISKLTDEYRSMYDWRRGQCLFNALYALYPDIANQIRGTDVDPFHRDERIPDCWNTAIALMQGKEVGLIDEVGEILTATIDDDTLEFIKDKLGES